MSAFGPLLSFKEFVFVNSLTHTFTNTRATYYELLIEDEITNRLRRCRKTAKSEPFFYETLIHTLVFTSLFGLFRQSVKHAPVQTKHSG